jgi:hypothetical protein
MNPGDIGPHPDAPQHYITMGRPPSMTDEQCGSLSVRRIGATGDLVCEPAQRVVRQDYEDGQTLYPCFMSEWVPTDEEREQIAAGQPVRMLIVGNSLPPVSLWVRGTDEV